MQVKMLMFAEYAGCGRECKLEIRARLVPSNHSKKYKSFRNGSEIDLFLNSHLS
jgi:hypothetical protein